MAGSGDARSCTLTDSTKLKANLMILSFQCSVGCVAGLQFRCRPCSVCSTAAPCLNQAAHLARQIRVAELQDPYATGQPCNALLCAYFLDAWLHMQVHTGTQAYGPTATVSHIHAGQQAPAAQCRPGSTCQLCGSLSRLHCTGRSGNQPSCKPTALWFI